MRRLCGFLGFLLGLTHCADDGPNSGGTGGGTDGGSTTGGSSAGGSAAGAGGSGSGPGGSGASGGSGGGGSGTGAGGAAGCADVTSCGAALPDVGPARDWNHLSSQLAAVGGTNHRGRDMFYNPGDQIWVMGKFAYGVLDDDIADEEIDLYLNEGCGDAWIPLGTVNTTDDGDHPTVEGVEDSGGWVYFDATSLGLGEGRHRFLMVVAGDLTTTEVYIDIVAAGTPIIVSDVDGTLTTQETEEFTALLTGQLPNANPDSAAVLTALATQGYRVFYLTARPEFLGRRTREFLEAHDYPLGLVHTTLSFGGATGSAAVAYKSGELEAIAARGLVPSWAFGNTDSDAEAFAGASVPEDDHRVMFQFTDDAFGSRRIEAYGELLAEIAADPPPVCP